MNYYEHHLGDYMRDTAHLSLIEDGVYRRLIDAYYAREKPLPNDLAECCKLARVSARHERAAVAYVLKEFFRLEDDGWHQKKCDEVISKFRDKSAKAKLSARASVESRQRTHSERIANAERTLNERSAPNLQSPVTSNQEPEALRAPEAPKVPASARMTPEGEMAIALRDLGVAVRSTDPVLHGWVRDGYTPQQATDAVGIARIRKPHPEAIPANYLDKILRQPIRPPPERKGSTAWDRLMEANADD